MYIGIKFKYFTIYLYLDLILIVPATCTFDEIENELLAKALLAVCSNVCQFFTDRHDGHIAFTLPPLTSSLRITSCHNHAEKRRCIHRNSSPRTRRCSEETLD